MRHPVANIVMLVFGTAITWLGIHAVMADSTAKSRIEYQDTWAYERFIRSYEAIHALRKQVSPAPGIENALSASQEMTVILLDRSNSIAATKALAYMDLLKVDGAVAEDQACAVLQKRKKILPYLEEAKVTLKDGHCVMQEVSLKPDQTICADPKEALRRIESHIRAINNGKTCKQ
jgi:hypothetical protein